MSGGALIAAQGLALGYDGMRVVEELNFRVASGDYLCIVGENGSGKSTLMRAMIGLIAPMAGEIVLGDGLKRNEIGYLPQQTQVQRDFPALVSEIVQSGCLNRCGLRPFYNRAERKLAHDAMEKLGIAALCAKCYRELSGGQQQRVLLARALCATRKMLLLDEPVAGLDPTATAELYRMIERLNREEGVAVIMVSHDVAAAAQSASHILHIGRRPLFFGSKADYLQTDIGRAYVAAGGGDA